MRVCIPIWLTHGVILGGTLPSAFGLPLWTTMAGMLVGPAVLWCVQKRGWL